MEQNANLHLNEAKVCDHWSSSIQQCFRVFFFMIDRALNGEQWTWSAKCDFWDTSNSNQLIELITSLVEISLFNTLLFSFASHAFNVILIYFYFVCVCVVITGCSARISQRHHYQDYCVFFSIAFAFNLFVETAIFYKHIVFTLQMHNQLKCSTHCHHRETSRCVLHTAPNE